MVLFGAHSGTNRINLRHKQALGKGSYSPAARPYLSLSSKNDTDILSLMNRRDFLSHGLVSLGSLAAFSGYSLFRGNPSAITRVSLVGTSLPEFMKNSGAWLNLEEIKRVDRVFIAEENMKIFFRLNKHYVEVVREFKTKKSLERWLNYYNSHRAITSDPMLYGCTVSQMRTVNV